MSASLRHTRRRAAASLEDCSSTAPSESSNDQPTLSTAPLPTSSLNAPKRTRENPNDDNSNSELARVLTGFLSTLATRDAPRAVVNGDAVPTFDPADTRQTSEAWVKKVDELSELNNWPETATTHYATAKLKGLARTWYESLTTLNYTWEEWKARIIEAFPTTLNYAEALSEMLKRQKTANESYANYYYEKLALLNRVRIAGKDAVSCLIHGILDPIIRAGAEAGDHATPQGLYQYLGRITMPSTPKPGHNGGKHYGTGSRISQHREKQQTKCSNCHKYGHLTQFCRVPVRGYEKRPGTTTERNRTLQKSTELRPTTGAKCYLCKQIGHLSYECPTKTNI